MHTCIPINDLNTPQLMNFPGHSATSVFTGVISANISLNPLIHFCVWSLKGKNVISYAWSICIVLESRRRWKKLRKKRNQMKYEHGISATNSNSLVEKRYSNGFATTTHYIIGTQGRELKFSFSRLCFSSLLWRTLLRVLYASFHFASHLERQTTESCELNWHKAKCERDVINDIFTHAQISDSSAFSAIDEPAVDWKNVREPLRWFVNLCLLISEFRSPNAEFQTFYK